MVFRIATAVVLPLALAGAACQDNWQSFVIEANLQPGDPPECAIPTDRGAAGYLGGVLDISVRYSYSACLFVSNRLVKREDYGVPRAESNMILVQGAYLRFEPDPNDPAPALLPDQDIPFAGSIPPQDNSTMCIPIIPSSIGGLLAPDRMFVAVVQFYGVTLGGIDVLTQEFRYPVWTCAGCLAGCPNDTNPLTPACECPTGNPEGDPPCRPGQDEWFDRCHIQ
ncbi:MAG: hypothetical protein QME96_09515 [Myxococcota bacterium]|nr:hypothetical protein [Myxococcota bacterium]